MMTNFITIKMSLESKKLNKKLSRGFTNALRRLDAFGKPVGLKFDGKETYKTSYGGVITVGFYIWMLFVTY